MSSADPDAGGRFDRYAQALPVASIKDGDCTCFLTNLPFLGLWAPILCLKSRQIIACPVTCNGTKR